MLQRDSFFRGLIAAPLFFLVSPVSSQDIPSIVFQCDTEKHPQICEALAASLQQRQPGHGLAVVKPGDTRQAALTIRYQEEKRSSHFVSGQLVWQEPNGKPVTGPALEFSVMDSNVENVSLAPFAQALIEVSELPILKPVD
ncbi:hypothetical protein [Pseudophaeobacter sp.]|uniref:hypothetical protein n=1 Tax=Pseudophaeobacter sp. TaxID=1971739 RepID=UPI003297B497